MLMSARHYVGRAMRAAQTGDVVAAAEADIGLRATRIAKVIRKANAGKPPLPPDVVRMLSAMLIQDGAA